MSIAPKIQWCDSTCPMLDCEGCELWTPRVRKCYVSWLHREFQVVSRKRRTLGADDEASYEGPGLPSSHTTKQHQPLSKEWGPPRTRFFTSKPQS
jgi:hypothetical protein